MKALILRLSIAALLSCTVALVMADPNGRGDGRGHFDRPGGDRMAPDRLSQDRGERHDEGRAGREDSERERRGSRLSPEERRALRQQINEAGQDLYQPKR